MNGFQIGAVLFCLAQAFAALRRYSRSRQTPSLFFAATWCGAIVFVASPDLTTRLAHYAGIGRGADFVTYGLLLTFLWAHYQQYLRYKRIENSITSIVRELAILNATRQADAPSSSESGET